MTLEEKKLIWILVSYAVVLIVGYYFGFKNGKQKQ